MLPQPESVSSSFGWGATRYIRYIGYRNCALLYEWRYNDDASQHWDKFHGNIYPNVQRWQVPDNDMLRFDGDNHSLPEIDMLHSIPQQQLTVLWAR